MSQESLHERIVDLYKNRKQLLIISGAICLLTTLISMIKGVAILAAITYGAISFLVFFFGYLAQVVFIFQLKNPFCSKKLLIMFCNGSLYFFSLVVILGVIQIIHGIFSSDPKALSIIGLPLFLGVTHSVAEMYEKIENYEPKNI